MEPDFSGYATKANLKCSDGRTIMPDAFAHMSGKTVPLVWQHGHNSPENILGHAVLENRKDGVYAQGFFNTSPAGKNAKLLVQHGDIKSLSIYANQLVERGKQVFHGMIREVSLVLSGANPGAMIDFVAVRHADGDVETLEDEAIIFTGLDLEHSAIQEPEDDETDQEDETDAEVEHAAADLTVQDVYDTLTEEQKNVVHFLIGEALNTASPSGASMSKMMQSEDAENNGDEGNLNHKEGNTDVTKNVFEQSSDTKTNETYALTHEDVKGIFADAVRLGSVREAAEKFALQHGIDNIDVMFPDAKTITSTPELVKRRTEWVAEVLGGVRSTPFSRVKSLNVDITQEEARAKGYVKGAYKAEEWVGATKRTTSPTTIYKKQKLERDDMLDITDFDVAAFLKAEMRVMLDEEVARAILIGDGRDAGSADKVKDPAGASDGIGIRSILNDHELYVTTVNVNVDDANSSYDEIVDAVMDGMEFYKGTGTPVFFTTIPELNKFKQAKDTTGRRLYETNAAVAEALGVSKVVNCEPMKEVAGLVGIIVNLGDFNVGTDRGGEVSLFDDFDIDYNNMKYLMETRLSGALVRPKTAIVIKKVASTAVKLAAPTKPTFVSSTGVVTVPTMAHVTYTDADGDTLTAGAQTALTAGQSLTVHAVADTGYYFANSAEKTWTFLKRS